MRGDVPEDAAVESVRQRAPREVAGKACGFARSCAARSHRDDGDGRALTMRLTVRVDNLRRFLDPSGRDGGTVHVTGMTTGPAAVDQGSLHLLAVADGGPRRTMDSFLPFDDDTGERWWLEGAKHVVRQGRGPWRASTEPDLALTRPQERYAGLAPTWARDTRVPLKPCSSCRRCVQWERVARPCWSRSSRSSPPRWRRHS